METLHIASYLCSHGQENLQAIRDSSLLTFIKIANDSSNCGGATLIEWLPNPAPMTMAKISIPRTPCFCRPRTGREENHADIFRANHIFTLGIKIRSAHGAGKLLVAKTRHELPSDRVLGVSHLPCLVYSIMAEIERGSSSDLGRRHKSIPAVSAAHTNV